jgi:hypothetical protein
VASSSVTLKWLSSGSKTVTVNYNNASGCSGLTAASSTTTVNARPTPSFTASAGATECASTDVTYTTLAGQSAYVWTVSGTLNTDYTITSGGTGAASSSLTLKWLSSGSKTVTVNYNNASGCSGLTAASSTTTVNSRPIPSFTTGSATACAGSSGNIYTTETGMSGYSWNVPSGGTIDSGAGTNSIGVTWSTAGSHTVQVNYINGNNCTATTPTSFSVNVNPIPTVNVGGAMAPICQGGTSADLGGSFGGGATSAIWSAPSGTFSNNTGSTPGTATFTAAVNSTTPITLTLTTGGGSCGTTFLTKQIVVNPNPTVNVGGVMAPICQGGISAALGGSFGGGATSAVWSDGGAGGTFINNGGSTPGTTTYTASATSVALVTLTITTAGGSCGTISSTKTITVNPLPIATAGSNSPQCVGQTLNLTASGGTSYNWAGPNGFTSTQQNPSISNVSLAASGNYTVTVTNANGCTSVTTTSVTVNAAPTVSISVSPMNVICSGTNVTFTAIASNAGVNPFYQWQINGVNVTGATSSAFSSTTLANTQKVTVVITADPTYCSSVATSNMITMTVNPPLTPTVSILESANNICAGSPVTFTSIVVNGGSIPGYQWQINGADVNGATNSSFSSSTLANGDQVKVIVNSNVSCAINNPATSNTVTMQVNPLISPATSIVASTNTICPGTSVTYTASSTNGGSNPTYQWKVNGVNAGSNSPTFTTATLANGDVVRVVMTSNASCASPSLATSNDITMTVNPGTPAIPAAISGTNPTCPGLIVQTYSVSAVPNATTYNWTVPTGWSITSGATTNSITVTTGAAGQNGTITVNASNSCGTSAIRTLNVTVNNGTPAAPGAISGTTPVCPSIAGLSYSIAAVPNATSYTWSAPAGWTITAGQGTMAITVTSGSTGQNGDITVVATNSCGTSLPNILPVIVNPGTPTQPGAITGTATQCPGLTGQSYSITAVPNANSYTWTVPAGWTITGGMGTSAITVTSGSAGQNGNITVTATNTCGTSISQLLAVTVNPGTPAIPGLITGAPNQCISKTGLIYSIAAVPNATTYTWTVPAGWTITAGPGTTSITVSTTAGAVSGNITVTAGNSCGTSSTSTLAVIASPGAPAAPATPSPKAGQANSICPVAVGLVYSTSAVVNATSYTWNVPANWTITSGQGTTSITVDVGVQPTGDKNISVTANNACGSATSGNLIVTVGTFASVNAGADQTVCVGTRVISLQSTVGGATNSANDLTWTAPSGTFSNANKDNPTYTIDNTLSTNGGSVVLMITARAEGNCPIVTDQMVVTVLPNPTATITGTTVICYNSTSTINFTATPNTTVTYTINGGAGITFDIGATGTASINTGALIANKTYALTNVAYTNAPTCGQTASGSATITVNTLATVNAGSPQTICAGSTATMAGIIGGSATSATWSGGGGTFSPNATTLNAVYTPTAAEILAGTTTLTLTTNDPNGPCGAATASILLTINQLATVSAGAAQTICAGSTATMAGVIGGSATSANWSGGGGSFSPNNIALNATYTPTAAEILAGSATLTLTTNDPLGPCGSATASMILTINPIATVNAGTDQTICSTSTVTLTGAVGGGASSGTWSGGNGTFNPNNTTLNAVYTPSASEVADGLVLLTLTTNDPAGPCAANSDQVQIAINPAATVNAGLDQNICQGSFIILSGTIGGAATSGTWSGGTGTFSPNNTTLNATYTPGAAETGLVILTLTTNDPAGSCGSVFDQVAITIDPKPLVTVSPDQMICSNATATVVGSFGGGANSAIWSTSGSGTFNDNTSGTAVYTPSNGDISTGAVTLTYTTNDPAGICGPASASLILTVKKVIIITSQPVNTGVCATYPADLMVTAAGDNLIYQWYRGLAPGGSQVVNSSNITGAQAATLHFKNVAQPDDGTYYVVISSANACSTETSNSITLNVDEEITVTTQLQSKSACIGDPVIFTIVAEPAGLLTYQWRKDGVDIPGKTTNTLDLGNVTLADNGNFEVQIKGLPGYTCSNAQSALATLTVHADATMARSSAPGTDAQNACFSQPINNITYVIGGGATNAGVTGLPPGVTGVFNAGGFTISGTPTATGVFNYNITTSGNCVQASATGTITVNPSPTITLGTPSNYCPAVSSFTLPYLSITGTPVSYSISAGVPALSGFVPLVDAALGASPINVALPAGVLTGTYQFIITVKNNNNCSSVNQTFTVTFQDVIPPVRPVLPNVNEQCSVTITPPTTTDNCSGTITGTTTTTFPFITTGTSTIVWTFTDASGNSTTANQVITIDDTTSPTWNLFPGDLTLECGASLNTTPAATGTPTATDNCGPVTITQTESVIQGACPSRYTIKRTWKATDVKGNSITKDQLINIVDTTAPQISCVSYTNFDANVVPASELHTGVTATDNCSSSGAIIFELISEEYFGLDNTAGFCPSSLERVYRAIDACGNISSTCTQRYTFIDNPNCQSCIDDPTTQADNVPFYPVIFTKADESWTSPNVVRNGVCCFAEGPPPPKCISFNVYLNENAVGLIFTIPTGAVPGGSLYYHVDCGPPKKVGEVLCLSGGRFYTITFCEPGNNPNTYKIQSISGATKTENIITRADANCVKNIEVTGLEQNAFLTWKVKYPANADSLLNSLSCINCLSPVFTPNKYTPPTIIYEVCGQVVGSYQCGATALTDCADVTVTTLPAIKIAFDVNLGNICANNIPTIHAGVTPVLNYTYQWYDGSNGTGNLMSSNSDWTPTVQGNFSLVVTETQSGLTCNSSTNNFNLTFDTFGPSTLNVPANLVIECNDPGAEAAIAAWIALANAADDNISSIPVQNDYAIFTHSCGAVRVVKFWADDICGNRTLKTAEIHIKDTKVPTWVSAVGSLNRLLSCSDNIGLANAQALAPVATDVCDPSLTLTKTAGAFVPDPACPNGGTYTNTWIAQDDCLNTSILFTQTITITDTSPPVIATQAQNGSSACVSVNPMLDAGYVAWLATNGGAIANDACDNNLTWTNNSATQTWVIDLVNHTKTITVIFTATDDCTNNVQTSAVTYTLNDDLNPTIVCPQSSNVVAPDLFEDFVSGNGCTWVPTNVPNPIYNDICGTVKLTYVLSGATVGNSPATGFNYVSSATLNLGITTVTYTVYDAAGNTSSCAIRVWIKNIDQPRFNISCPTGTDQNILVSADVDKCDKSVTFKAPLIDNFCVEIFSASYQIDANLPVLVPVVAASQIPSITQRFTVGVHTISWVITSASGTPYPCTQTVTVTDDQKPTIACQDDVEDFILDGGCTLISNKLTDPVTFDNCSAQLTYHLVFENGTFADGNGPVTNYSFPIGKTQVTYTVTDPVGAAHNVSCSFQVWIKNIINPHFNVICQTGTDKDIVLSAEADKCDASVTFKAPVIDNFCVEVFGVTYQIDANLPVPVPVVAGSPIPSITQRFTVGLHTISWVITSASGTPYTCPQTVKVTDDQDPTITCPVNPLNPGGPFVVQTDLNKAYASNINVPKPTNIGDNCSYVLTWTMSLAGVSFDASTNTTGESFVPTTYPKLNLGDNIITYTIDDGHGNVIPCSFTIKIEGIPGINCPVDIAEITDPNLCTTTLNPGIPTLKPGSAPADTWNWVMTGATVASGTSSGIIPASIGNYPFNLGLTMITWTASNVSGTSSPCTQTITVTDQEAPTFTLPATVVSYCVSNILSAVYNPNSTPLIVPEYDDLTTPRPEYYTMTAVSKLLNLDATINNFNDNCCADNTLIIHWEIIFAPTPDPSTKDHDPITKSPITAQKGQPSAYGDIDFPGDGVTFLDVIHQINYWLEDCHGNPASNPTIKTLNIIIKPRPNLIKTTMSNP